MGGRNIGYVVIGHCWQVSLAGASCGAANKLLGRNNTKLSSTQVNNPKEEVHSVNKGGLSKKDSKSGIKNYRNCGGSHAAEQKSCLVFGCTPPLSQIVFGTLNDATCYVYPPKAFETLTQGECYGYWFLKGVIHFISVLQKR